MAALGGAVVGLLAGMNETVRQWRVGGFDAHDLLYFAAAAGTLLIVVVTFLGRKSRKGFPFITTIAGFVILGIAFNGLMRDFTGQIAELLTWASGCSFGAAMALFLVYWMTRRARRREEK